MAKDPTIPFYAQDFYIDTLQWSEAEVGAYIRLLCTLWINGFCYNSAIELANVSPLAKQVVDKYSDKFVFYDDNKFSSKRLEDERDKRIKNREIRSIAGKKGAESRWQTDSKDHDKKITKVNESEDVIEYNNVLINIEFEIFWNLYDKKVSKPKTELLWAKLNDKERELIIDYIPKYKRSQPDKAYRKNPDVFLRNRAWEDEIVTKQPEDGRGVRRTHAPISDERKKEYSKL